MNTWHSTISYAGSFEAHNMVNKARSKIFFPFTIFLITFNPILHTVEIMSIWYHHVLFSSLHIERILFVWSKMWQFVSSTESKQKKVTKVSNERTWEDCSCQIMWFSNYSIRSDESPFFNTLSWGLSSYCFSTRPVQMPTQAPRSSKRAMQTFF